MSKTSTKYLIVPYAYKGSDVAVLLDSGYTLVISWVAGDNVHHILSKELEN